MTLTLTDTAPESRGGSKSTVYNFDIYVRFRPLDFSSDSSNSNINSIVTVDEIYTVLDDIVDDTETGEIDDSDPTDGQQGSDGTIEDAFGSESPTGVPTVGLPEENAQADVSRPILVEDSDDFIVTDKGEATISFPERIIVPAQW